MKQAKPRLMFPDIPVTFDYKNIENFEEEYSNRIKRHRKACEIYMTQGMDSPSLRIHWSPKFYHFCRNFYLQDLED